MRKKISTCKITLFFNRIKQWEMEVLLPIVPIKPFSATWGDMEWMGLNRGVNLSAHPAASKLILEGWVHTGA